MSEVQKRRWPRALSQAVWEGDRAVFERFPRDVPLIVCSGQEDPLVPPGYTERWLERRREVEGEGKGNREEMTRVWVQGNTGHSCTKEMVGLIAGWIAEVFGAERGEADVSGGGGNGSSSKKAEEEAEGGIGMVVGRSEARL